VQKDAWVTHGVGAFDWSRVDGIRILAERSESAPAPVHVDIGAILSSSAPAHAAVAFVFDDGYSSILPAAAYLHAKGMPATVAVIAKYVELPSFAHLNVDQLHVLQDDWGWDMANHTQSHVDAVAAYRKPLRLGAYEQDVLRGALFLRQAHLDSAPNWFVYPHGTTDIVLDRVVRRFYKFARTTDGGPEAFPYGSPLRVKTLEVHNPGDSEGGASQEFTTPDRVQRAVLNAKRYHLTLILTFHRIHSRPDDRAGYPFRDFRRIVDGVAAAGIRVTTLSGLDRLAGVPEDNRIVVRPARPSQLTVQVHATGPRPGLLTRFWHLLS
jgi:peptidoglycan/xylan/chitin deacetylase (PgdA/CDA1 family)